MLKERENKVDESKQQLSDLSENPANVNKHGCSHEVCLALAFVEDFDFGFWCVIIIIYD